MKVAVITTISADKVAHFQKDGIKKIVFAKIDQSVDYASLAANYILVNAFENTSAANWYNYNLVCEKTKKLKSAFPEIFLYKGYDLEAALNKDLFWSYLFTNALLFECEKIKAESVFIFYDRRTKIKKSLSLLRRIFYYKHQSYEIIINDGLDEVSRKFAFRLNDTFMVDVYGNLFDTLGKNNILPYQSINNSETKKVNQQLLETFGVNYTTKAIKHNPLALSLITKIRLFFYAEDEDFINTLIYLLNTLCNHVDQYERLFKTGVRKVIMNAGENEGEGNVVCLVASKYKGVTFNYMNGTKAKDPQNMNTFFDYWFMPDRTTKELLLSYCQLQERQLPVTGHVLQDTAELHEYSGTLDPILERLTNKKVIALLTSRIYALEKQNVLKMLADYLDLHPDVIVLVRKHPSETITSDSPHDRIITVPNYPNRMAQKSLFDLFLLSNLAISFSSMVSYQASWFNIPSINFELLETSRLPFVDNTSVFHANDIAKLRSYLDKFLSIEKSPQPIREKANASKKIANIISQA